MERKRNKLKEKNNNCTYTQSSDNEPRLQTRTPTFIHERTTNGRPRHQRRDEPFDSQQRARKREKKEREEARERQRKSERERATRGVGGSYTPDSIGEKRRGVGVAIGPEDRPRKRFSMFLSRRYTILYGRRRLRERARR